MSAQPGHLGRGSEAGIGVLGDHGVAPCQRRGDVDLRARSDVASCLHRLAGAQQRLGRDAWPVGGADLLRGPRLRRVVVVAPAGRQDGARARAIPRHRFADVAAAASPPTWARARRSRSRGRQVGSRARSGRPRVRTSRSHRPRAGRARGPLPRARDAAPGAQTWTASRQASGWPDPDLPQRGRRPVLALTYRPPGSRPRARNPLAPTSPQGAPSRSRLGLVLTSAVCPALRNVHELSVLTI
jgi:hypothetical protein